MAKAIKFNLVMDGRPVRNLEDMRDNFNVEDLLGAYGNGSLKRWLDTREMEKESAELDKISGDEINAAVALCRIFRPDCTDEQLRQAAYPFEFRRKDAETLEKYRDLKKQREAVILEYHKSYDGLLMELEKRSDDYSFVKPALAEIFENYLALYELDAEAFYGRYIKNHPLVVLGMLANSGMRPIIARQQEQVYKDIDIGGLTARKIPQSAIDAFLKKWEADQNQPGVESVSNSSENMALRNKKIAILILHNHDDSSKYGKVHMSGTLGPNHYPIRYIPIDVLRSTLPAQSPTHVKTSAGETEGYWRDIQPAGKNFLIIKMENETIIRNAGVSGEELKAEDVNGKFPILNGIDYKSANASHKLVYMEV